MSGCEHYGKNTIEIRNGWMYGIRQLQAKELLELN